MSIDDYYWTADTLFSTINTPFPFPDPREIGTYFCLLRTDEVVKSVHLLWIKML